MPIRRWVAGHAVPRWRAVAAQRAGPARTATPGVECLGRLDHGGGLLATRWVTLRFDPVTGLASDFVRRVVAPIRKFAGKNIDLPIRDQGRAAPSGSHAARQASSTTSYTMTRRSWICRRARCGRDTRAPTFVFNATNLEAGSLRFSKQYCWDWCVGRIRGERTFRSRRPTPHHRRSTVLLTLEVGPRPGGLDPGPGDPGLEDPTSFQSNVLLAEWRV